MKMTLQKDEGLSGLSAFVNEYISTTDRHMKILLKRKEILLRQVKLQQEINELLKGKDKVDDTVKEVHQPQMKGDDKVDDTANV